MAVKSKKCSEFGIFDVCYCKSCHENRLERFRTFSASDSSSGLFLGVRLVQAEAGCAGGAWSTLGQEGPGGEDQRLAESAHSRAVLLSLRLCGHGSKSKSYPQ